MIFLAPLLLLGLLLVPILLALYLWAQRRRTRYAVRFTNLDLLANLAPRRPAWRRHLPPALYLAAVAALVLGLARPTMVVATPREDATVLLTIDVSGSMRATDVEPTRLDAAREAARSFVAQLPEGVRLGIVSFASRPETLVAPTTDRESIEAALQGLTAKDGTAMGDGLMRTLDLAEQIQSDDADPRAPVDTPSGEPLVAAILLSDGANSVGDTEPLDAAERAATLGVPVYTIALGTVDGEVQVRDDIGQLHTLQVPPDTETLAQIAEVTGGTAFDAPTAQELSAVYDNLQSRVGYVDERQEITSWFAAAALVLVVVGAGFAAVWFGRLP